MHVLDWVEGRGRDFPASLNDLIQAAGARVGQDDAWMPRGRTDPAEACLARPCERLVPLDVSKRLRAWWLGRDHPLANEPNWDLAATARFDDGRKGIVLVEAKAHLAELAAEAKGKTAGHPENDASIGRAITETATALGGADAGVNLSRDSHYQFANRIAFAWKLASLGLPTVLIYLGFTGDLGIRDRGEPLRDDRHWREAVLQHTQGVLPPVFFERPIDLSGTPLLILIRSLGCVRQSPSPLERRQIVERANEG